jgi:hypothetical protein
MIPTNPSLKAENLRRTDLHDELSMTAPDAEATSDVVQQVDPRAKRML